MIPRNAVLVKYERFPLTLISSQSLGAVGQRRGQGRASLRAGVRPVGPGGPHGCPVACDLWLRHLPELSVLVSHRRMCQLLLFFFEREELNERTMRRTPLSVLSVFVGLLMPFWSLPELFSHLCPQLSSHLCVRQDSCAVCRSSVPD